MQESWNLISLSQRVSASIAENEFSLGALQVVLGLMLTAGFLTVVALVLVYAERKIAAHFQCRLGPMRVGWHGTLQTIADALKLLLKEDIVPHRADALLHLIAPFLCMLAAVLSLIALPLGPSAQIADMNIGALYLLAVSGFGVLGILLGGWGSNNKWSLLGAMRAGAQIISYELSVTISVMVIVILSGSLKLSDIVLSQQEGWWIWRAPVVGIVSFLVFLIASTAEINRTPFDLAEGESELTAGFHTEYSGMRFSFFFLAEYINMFTVSALGATLFLGGWMPFHIGSLSTFNSLMDLLPPGAWFALKSSFIIFLIMWFRWTFPRLRVDQLMKLEWKILLPIGFLNLFAAALMTVLELYFFPFG